MIAGAFEFLVAGPDAGGEAIQHALKVVDGIQDRSRRIRLGEAELLGELRLVAELTRLAACKVERVKKFPVALPATAFLANFGSLYPAYVRGLTYLAARKPAEAGVEFQKIISHRGIVAEDPVDASPTDSTAS